MHYISIKVMISAFEERGYNVCFSPYHRYFDYAMETANEICKQKVEYLETLDDPKNEAQGQEELKSEVEEEDKDTIFKNSILNAELTNVDLDKQELSHLNS